MVHTAYVSPKLLLWITGILLVAAVILSLTDYPKLLSTSRETKLEVQNNSISIRLNQVTKDTTHHLLKNSTTYNITLSTKITANTDRRLENTNFYINCYVDSKLVNCTNGSPIQTEPTANYFVFSRDWSRVTKTPLDTTLIAQSQPIEYRPEFFGIDLRVTRIALLYTDRSYSRTDLQATTTSDLQLPVEVDWPIEAAKQ
jgi:archaellum component FlaG (FlaF/FlaG flagellin family)